MKGLLNWIKQQSQADEVDAIRISWASPKVVRSNGLMILLLSEETVRVKPLILKELFMTSVNNRVNKTRSITFLCSAKPA